MDLYVGLAGSRGRIERYSFDLLELQVSPSLPKTKTLRALRAAKPQLVFSLRLQPEIIEGAPTAQGLLEKAMAAAETLDAKFLVVASGPRFRPTTLNRRRLTDVCETLRKGGVQVAWEPRGMWSAHELQQWSDEAGALLVRDLTRESAPSGPIVYTRLLPFGVGTRVTQNAVEKLAEQIAGKTAAYVVIQGEGAHGARARLRQWLELAGDDEEPVDDDAEEDGLDGSELTDDDGDADEDS